MCPDTPPVRYQAVQLSAPRCTLPCDVKPSVVYWCPGGEPPAPFNTALYVVMHEGHDYKWVHSQLHIFYNHKQEGGWTLLQWGEGENTMPCKDCGEAIPDYSKFCSYCGEPQ